MIVPSRARVVTASSIRPSACHTLSIRHSFSTSPNTRANQSNHADQDMFNWLLAKTTMATPKPPTHFPSRPVQPRPSQWPYQPHDFQRMDESSDDQFYTTPRLVTHIDDGAIAALRAYYAQNLPVTGRILDLCSSWISHLPVEHEAAVTKGDLRIVGVGMNARELDRNLVLTSPGARIVQDLNERPALGEDVRRHGPFDAVTCVVSIDYLTSPREVLEHALRAAKEGGSCHLAISNRCFPTKAIARWLRISEEERLRMVGHYLQFAGWSDVQIVDVVGKGGWGDPLWVVRGTKT